MSHKLAMLCNIWRNFSSTSAPFIAQKSICVCVSVCACEMSRCVYILPLDVIYCAVNVDSNTKVSLDWPEEGAVNKLDFEL